MNNELLTKFAIIAAEHALKSMRELNGGDRAKQLQTYSDAYNTKFAELVAEHVRETEFKPDWLNYREGRAAGAEEERQACLELCEQAIKMNLETKDYILKTGSNMDEERIIIETAICIAAIKQAEKLATAIRAKGEVK